MFAVASLKRLVAIAPVALAVTDKCDYVAQLDELVTTYSNRIFANPFLCKYGSELKEVTTTPISRSKNELLRKFRIAFWQKKETNDYDDAKELSEIGVPADEIMNVYDSRTDSCQSIVTITFNPKIIGDVTDPWYVLDLKHILENPLKLDTHVDIVSIYMANADDTKDTGVEVKIKTDYVRIKFPKDKLTDNIIITLVFNTEACAAKYSGTGTGTSKKWSAVVTSKVFKNGKAGLKEFAPKEGDTKTTYEFKEYEKKDCDPSLCQIINKFRNKIEACELIMSISNNDLAFIKASCEDNRFRLKMLSRLARCKKTKRSCKVDIVTVFHKYTAFCISSMKSLIVCWSSSRAAKCRNVFSRCARRCEDKFEGCNLAMLIISQQYTISASICLVIEGIFGEFIGYNPYFNIHFKAAARIYGLARSDCRYFDKYIGDDHAPDHDYNEEEVIESPEEQARKRQTKPTFFGRFRWVIIVTITVTVVACAVYAFAF